MAKLLPVIRCNAIHLGPFTSYDFGVIYAITSVKTISKNVVNIDLWKQGISPQMQLKSFVQACYILNKSVGFDLEPHVAQFAKTVLENPRLFRWISLDNSRKLIHPQHEQLQNEYQEKICSNVQFIVKNMLRNEELTTLESESGDSVSVYNRKEDVYHKIIAKIIEEGYWTIPCQTWNGYGLPLFNGYNREGNYAKFLYIDKYGQDKSDNTFSIVTPYKFCEITEINGKDCSVPAGSPVINNYVTDFYNYIFNYWRDEYDFDFIRHDSVDHIFDSIDEKLEALSDRPSPYVLKSSVSISKQPSKKYIGNLAERMGQEFIQYNSLGFDLILGSECLEKMTSDFITRQFELNERLAKFNSTQKTSIAFAVETHDTGDRNLWGQPIISAIGANGMRVRFFLSRFFAAGRSFRPKYEVMGAQDLSYGLYESNVYEKNLNWIGDKYFNTVYHYIEDVYAVNKELIQKGELLELYVDENYAWWIIRYNNRALIPVFSTENGYGMDYIKIPLEKVRQIEVHVDSIEIYNLEYLQCLLYEVEY